LNDLPVVVMNGFLLLEEDPVPESVRGIILPEQKSLRPMSGVVVKSGGDSVNQYPAGCRVVFGRYAGEKIRIGKEAFRLLHETEVQCLISFDVKVAV